MALKFLIAALLVSSVALAGPIFGAVEPKPSKPLTKKSPLDREWYVLLTAENGFTVGVDARSFTVLTPNDEFTFVTLMIFGKDTMTAPLGMPMPAAQITTVKASCSKNQAQIIADTFHDDTGKIIGTDEITKIDKMSPIEPSSIIGKIVTSVCTGKSLTKTQQKEYKRGDSIKNA